MILMGRVARARVFPIALGTLLAVVPIWKLVESQFRSNFHAKDPRLIAAGQVLFEREWSPLDPMAHGDGVGPVYNATSCVACHFQGGVGGGGPLDANVTLFQRGGTSGTGPSGLPLSGVVHRHASAPQLQETMAQVAPTWPDAPRMPLAHMLRRSQKEPNASVQFTQRNTPALFGAGLIDAIPVDSLVNQERQQGQVSQAIGLGRQVNHGVGGRIHRLPDGRVGRFGWKAEFATLQEFVEAACANELGLSNPSHDQASPLGMPEYRGKGPDLTSEECALMAAFVASLPRPVELASVDPTLAASAVRGREVFEKIGCADCHVPNLGSIEGLYSDLMLHEMGGSLSGESSAYGRPGETPPSNPLTQKQPVGAGEWRTPPLWGVADSAPYLHDGRAATLDEAIMAHGGEAQASLNQFEWLSPEDRRALTSFLETLRAPQPEPVAPAPSLAAQ